MSEEQLHEDARLVKAFARKHRLKAEEQDGPDDLQINAPRGSISFFEGQAEVFVYPDFDDKPLEHYQRVLAEAGIELDPESLDWDLFSAAFDPDNFDHIRAVFRVLGLRVPRRTSEKQRAQSLRALEKARAALQEKRGRTRRTEELSP